ncbi:hypothetical protein F4808DRAFT_415876 [Astrocystis sublimbata]|nr:hypothetical protein F4808DRAFT_415876 [Astrocystis sublimbata]
MASRGQHLEPRREREIVFCHGCGHEWYRDPRDELPGSPPCPVCHEDFTEIVTPETDPRTDSYGPADSGPDLRSPSHSSHLHSRHLHHHDLESDPEEADIEEHHFHGPGGMFGHRTIHRNPDVSAYGRQPRVQSSEDIIRRFTELLGEIGGTGAGASPFARSGPETLYTGDNRDGPRIHGEPRVTYRTFSGPNSSGLMSSFTITTAGSFPSARPRRPSGSEPQPGADDPFQRLFGDLLAMPPPGMRHRDNPHFHGSPFPGDDENGGPGRPPADIATALNQVIVSLINPNAPHGDVVYSQEALDRIITNLMENNPQSNAPPPATANAIASLQKKKLDEKMLGSEMKGECTICIDEVNVGDEVMVLPCNHWFHEECASLWLKQHNSCPVCRAAIDGAKAGRPRTEATRSEDSAGGAGPGPSSSERRRANLRQRGEERLDSIRNLGGSSYDRSRNHQRNSNSPPSQETSARPSPRVRSPTPSDRGSTQGDRRRDSRTSSNSGPFNWFRDRFSGR